MKAKEIMTPNPISVDLNATIGQAAERLFEADIRHLVVLNGRRLVGLLSDRDLRSYMLPVEVEAENPTAARERMEVTVEALVQEDCLFVYEDTDVGEIIDLIVDQRVGAVPVLGTGSEQLVGIISYIDILRALRDSA